MFHFITYVPFGGRVYELDGLRPGPCDLGESGSDWLGVARSAIQARIEKDSASEIKFNLMAIIRDKRAVLQEKRALLEAAGCAVSGRSEVNAYMENHEIYDFYTSDYVDGLADHLLQARDEAGVSTLDVVEVGAGDGRLSQFLRRALEVCVVSLITNTTEHHESLSQS